MKQAMQAVMAELQAAVAWVDPELLSLPEDKLRKFMIEYADRILFGTDIGGQPREGRYEQVAESYCRAFQLLETDRVIKGGFFGGTETKGLALPIDGLEKIYYRNAARLYPRVKDVLKDLVKQSAEHVAKTNSW